MDRPALAQAHTRPGTLPFSMLRVRHRFRAGAQSQGGGLQPWRVVETTLFPTGVKKSDAVRWGREHMVGSEVNERYSFADVAGHTEQLEIREVVGAVEGEWGDVVSGRIVG